VMTNPAIEILVRRVAQQTANRKQAIIPATTLTMTIVNRDDESIETDPPSRGDAESKEESPPPPLPTAPAADVCEGEVDDDGRTTDEDEEGNND